MKNTDNRVGGFVWIGRPGDELEKLILRSFEVLNALEGLIFKPSRLFPEVQSTKGTRHTWPAFPNGSGHRISSPLLS